jgi:hypothetical protein
VGASSGNDRYGWPVNDTAVISLTTENTKKIELSPITRAIDAAEAHQRLHPKAAQCLCLRNLQKSFQILQSPTRTSQAQSF